MPAQQPPALRERLRRQTREQIAEAAERLFSEQGFREVTVEAVAQAAGVSRQTVFNHFPVKEDLVFDRAGDFEAQMVAAVRDRPAGVGVVDAFRAGHRAMWTHANPRPDSRPQGGFFDLVAATPALQSYGRELNARTATAIADVLSDSGPSAGDDLRPRVLADALLAVYAATFAAIQRHILAGEPPERFLRPVLESADAALDLLQTGWSDYA